MESRPYRRSIEAAIAGIAIAFALTARAPLASAETVDLRIIETPQALLESARAGSTLIVVNFWATWCEPCVDEMPDLAEIDRAFDNRHVRLVGISLDDARPGRRDEKFAAVKKFLGDLGIGYSNYYYTGDPTELHVYWGTTGSLPTTLILDSSGIVLESENGPVHADTLIRDLRALLGD